MKQGAQANYTGNELEQFIQGVLNRKGYDFIHHKKFEVGKSHGKPIFTRQFNIADSVYDTPLRCDFLLHNPPKHPNGLIIEAKWQQVGGTVDEKYPYLVLNIKQQYLRPTIIVLDGGGYRKGAEMWLRAQIGGNLIKVFSMSEFQIWANKSSL